jgi:hypothetical protein
MNKPVPFSNDCIYALRLHIPAGQSLADGIPALSGQLEHVMSGRCYEFNAGGQLLACLSVDLTRVVAVTAPASQAG